MEDRRTVVRFPVGARYISLLQIVQLAVEADFRLPPRSRWELRSSGALRSEKWQFRADVSGQSIDPIFGFSTPWKWG